MEKIIERRCRYYKSKGIRKAQRQGHSVGNDRKMTLNWQIGKVLELETVGPYVSTTFLLVRLSLPFLIDTCTVIFPLKFLFFHLMTDEYRSIVIMLIFLLVPFSTWFLYRYIGALKMELACLISPDSTVNIPRKILLCKLKSTIFSNQEYEAWFG